MQQRYVWAGLAILGVTATVVACTMGPGTKAPATGTAATHDQLLAYTAQLYANASKPHHVHLDTLVADSGLKLKVTAFDADDGIKKKASSLSTKAEGDDTEVVEAHGTCKAAIGDEVPHDIDMVEDDWPVMGDHDNQCTITDLTSAGMQVAAANGGAKGQALFVTSDQEFQRFTATIGDQVLSIITNPDGTYTINGKPAATVNEAATLIVAHAVGRTASLESIGAIYGTLLERKKRLGQTLIPSGGGPVGPAGPPPPDPSNLVRAIIALREAQP